MIWPKNKRVTHFRYDVKKKGRKRSISVGALERFHAVGLRMAGFLHQFKTPLHVIQSQVELLRDDPTMPAHARASLELIGRNASRLSDQTRSILDLSRGVMSAWKEVPLETLVDDVCRAVEVDCRRHKITLDKKVEGSGTVRMDSFALEGALHNLFNNAIEAMPEGGTLRVRVTTPKNARRVLLEIQDTGCGMSNQDQRRILSTPFTSEKSGGSGLGLYISQYILRRHRASLRVESQSGIGTTIIVSFPKVKSSAPVVLPVSISLPASSAPSASLPEAPKPFWRRWRHGLSLLLMLVSPLRGAVVSSELHIHGRLIENQTASSSGVLTIRFSIWDSADKGGSPLWQDVLKVPVENQTYEVVLGQTTPLPSSVFSGGDRWMQLQLGEAPAVLPRYRLPESYLQAQKSPEAPMSDADKQTKDQLLECRRQESEQAKLLADRESAAREALLRQETLEAEEKLAREEAADEKRRRQEKAVREEAAREKRKLERQARAAKAKAEEELKPLSKPISLQGRVDSPAPSKTSYTVQEGDTLKSIAQKLFGDAELWYDLYYLNRDRLGPMGHLFPGQLLVLPIPGTGEHAK